MNCDVCGHDHRAGQRFCTQCGAALVLCCPACGHVVEPDQRFCGDCGASLQLSQASAASPATQTTAGERKQITVLFADVAGSMDLQERLDPEVWAEIMGRFVAILAQGVRRFGGTVDKFTGDGIMALFGAPIAQEDHARRACHAAWELTRTVGEYSEELRQKEGVKLNVRLGLNSGEVIVGRVGEDVTLDATALGHTVGLAQRMEAMAEPGRAYLTHHTARLVEGWFQLRDLGPTVVKGAGEPVGVQVLKGPVASLLILHGAGGLGTAPLVGRERELAVLEDALAAAEQGHARIVGVVGEAGVGKSRLCGEFALSAESRGATVLRTAGLAHVQNVPLVPILSLFRSYFGIGEAGDPAEARRTIAAMVTDLDPGLEKALPLLFDFFEVPDPQRPAPTLGSDARMRRIFGTLRGLARIRSQRQPLLLIFEDLHWFDPLSASFLGPLATSLAGSRTLVVANFRPEFSAEFTRHSYYVQLPLAPLADRAVGDLVTELLGPDSSLRALPAFMVERTGGNPFFVEEILRTLVEDGNLVGAPRSFRLAGGLESVRVPPSVQAVLSARIDRLPGEQKLVLQTAAVIGRTFTQPLLADVLKLGGEQLDRHLGELCGGELLQETSCDVTSVGYRFWHPLTQEVAYNSLLRSQRAKMHEGVARALVALEPERWNENAALVAHHFEASGDHAETARWEMRAARWTVRNDVTEAQRRWRSAIAHLEGASQTDEVLRLGVLARSLLLRLGARTGIDPTEAETQLQAAEAAAEQLDDASRMLAAFARGSVSFWRGQVGEAMQCYRLATGLSDATTDPGLRSMSRAALAVVTPYVGPVSSGLQAADMVLALSDGDPSLGVEAAGFSMHDVARFARAHLCTLGGQLGNAHDEIDSALICFDERPLAEYHSWTLALRPSLAYWGGETDDLGDVVHDALHLAENSGNLAAHCIALQAHGIAALVCRQAKTAADSFQRALEAARHRRCGLFEEGSLLAYLARARLELAEPDEAVRLATEAVDVARRQGAAIVECLALLTRGQLLFWTGGVRPEAHDVLDAARTLVHQTGALSYEPFIVENLARLEDDETQLREALRLYRKIGATGHARRLQGELAAHHREPPVAADPA